ncbi:PREDICTED: lipase member H-like [Nicrophorus vespilloides]|uniref:Lipase member H-like n=1 Tax=Nicrophorus vespilloides TaxID=110193 RepID=A0ABM1NKD8_NICVS|nr:PREDICTED: lipase member H-like [Nicrophorus vespilloides]
MLLQLVLIIAVAYGANGRIVTDEYEVTTDHFVLMASERDGVHLVNLKYQPPNTDVSDKDLMVYLFTRANTREGFQIKAEGFSGAIKSQYFDANKISLFVNHGYGGNYLGGANRAIRDAILSKHDVNVFLVDSAKAREFYTTAVLCAPGVSKREAEFIRKFADFNEVPYDKIHLAGHSLGAHVSGGVGAQLDGKVRSILGLDPALPLFSYNNTETRLDVTDGQFVQVIHTNAGLKGFSSSIGHADYFPNGGGMNQPGCGTDLLGSCAHARVYNLYKESVLTSGFLAKRCDSYENFKAGLCDHNPTSLMGEFPLDTRAKGDYYLDTAAAEPFALI